LQPCKPGTWLLLLLLAFRWGDANVFQILKAVVAGGRLDIPEPSQLPDKGKGFEEGLEAYVTLIRWCWDQDPAQRPSFHDIVRELRCVLVPMLAHAKISRTSSKLPFFKRMD
jgi:hypothetical protein